MMGGNAVSEEDVFRIADEVEASGQKVSNEAIRDALGRGSYTTISKYLRAWRSMKGASEKSVEPIPEQIAGRFQAFGQELWRTAFEVAIGRFSEERRELARLHAEAEAEVSELSAMSDALTQRRDELQIHLATANQELEEQRKAFGQANSAVVELRTRAEAAEGEAQRLEAHVADLRAEVKRLAKQNAELVSTLSRLSKPGPESAPG